MASDVNRKGGRGDGLSDSHLDSPLAGNDFLSRGTTYEKQTNPTVRTGRPDGMVHPELTDMDGFDADDSNVSGTWGGGQIDHGNRVDRIRPEINGQDERGYVLNERAAAMTVDCVTDAGGGAIKPI